MTLIERGVVATRFPFSDHAGSLMRMLDKHADQNMQFADSCLVLMSEITPNCPRIHDRRLKEQLCKAMERMD